MKIPVVFSVDAKPLLEKNVTHVRTMLQNCSRQEKTNI